MSGKDDNGGDLLGQIIGHTIDVGDDAPTGHEAPAEAEQAEPEEAVQSEPHRWAHDPDLKADIGGLRTGHRFEFVDCGEDLDGVWEILGMNLSHPNPAERTLTAGRPGEGPPYIKMTEVDFLDELRLGRAKIV